MKRFYRVCSLLLILCFLVNMLPIDVLASESQDSQQSSLMDPTDLSTGALVVEGKEDAYILGEILEERTAYSKTFRLSNGLNIAALYSEPVHYQKSGKWEEIDNTLQLTSTRTGSTYTNTAGSWQISFPQQLNDHTGVSIHAEDHSLHFQMTGQLSNISNTGLTTATSSAAVLRDSDQAMAELIADASLSPMAESDALVVELNSDNTRNNAMQSELIAEKAVSSLRYANVYANTDLTYDLISNQVKESIIIRQYSNDLGGYQYLLEMENLRPVLTDDNAIELYDKTTNDLVMLMPAPFLVDSSEQYCFDIGVLLQEKNGSYILSYILPQEWLAAEDRAWPVTLDPAVMSVANGTNTVDQTVYEYAYSSHTEGILNCGYEPACGKMRAYLRFNSLPDLGVADVIINATITLQINDKNGTGTTVVEARRVTEDWDPATIRWDTQPAFDENIVSDYISCAGVTRETWNITEIVRSWYETGNNYGLVLKGSSAVESAGINNWIRFRSANNPTGLRPALTITFRNNNGLENYWDYTASSAGRAGTGYVNNYSGNLVFIRDDIGFGGNRMPVTITHVYNSNDSQKNEFGMGYGWRTNFNQRVYYWNHPDAAGNYYVWEDSDGTAHYFYKQSTNTYLDEDGLQLTLEVTNTGYTIKDPYGNTSYFDSSGRLTKIENNQATKSSITITYIGDSYRISQIKDGVGRKYTFTYHGSNNLEKISYTGAGSEEFSNVQFAYSNSLLTTVTYHDGAKVRYSYISKGLLQSIRDVDGYSLTYTYSNASSALSNVPSRVKTVTETHNSTTGGNLTFTYGQRQTTITDAKGNVQIHQFNNWGNTISIQDDQGKAMFAQFAFNEPGETSTDASAKGNQLRLSSKLQNTVGNMLDNSSFESTSNWTATSGDVTCAGWNHSNTYHGNRFLRIQNTGTGTQGAASPSFSVKAGETYTFSAYVYSGSTKVHLDLYGTSVVASSETLTSNSGWTRLEVSYTATSNTTLKARILIEGSGTIFADCVQVEAAPSASRYNLVQNGDFRFNTSWSSTGGYTTPSIVSPAAELDARAYKLIGSPTATRRLSQTVAVSGDAGDSFVLAGWAIAWSIPLETGDSTAGLRKFGMILTFNNTDGTTSVHEVSFNPYVNNWQYAATGVKAEKAYSSIKIELAYDYNANNAWFDGIQLFKEEFGSTYTYDNKGNLAGETDIQGQSTSYTYNNKNDLTKITLPTGENVTYVYDNYHNVTSATSAEGITYTLTYDTWGNNLSVKIGNTISSSATYSSDGNRLVSTTDAAGKVTKYDYDPQTNVLLSVQYPKDTDGTNDTIDTRTKYEYDKLFRLKKTTANTDTGLGLSAVYTYQNDYLTSIATHSTTYNFTYGNFGLRSSVKVGSQTLASYTYENVTNLLKTLAYGNGDSVQYTYDNQGRLTGQSYGDSDTVTYLYDNDGALSTVIDSASGSKTKYFYDFAGRLAKFTEDRGSLARRVEYAYNEENQVSQKSEFAGNIRQNTYYRYDDFHRRTQVGTSSTWWKYTYDTLGRVATQRFTVSGADILTETVTYNNANQVQSIQKVTPENTRTHSYTYDANGNIATVTVGNKTIRYTYDTAGQLIREDNTSTYLTTVWTYDNAGNILSEKVYPYTIREPYELLEANSYTYGNSNWGDLLTAYNGQSITYDQIGNPLTYNNGTAWTFTWEHGRQLATMSDGTTTWTNTYNSDGLRTSRTNGTTTYNYYYEGSQLTSVTGSNGNIWIFYDGNRPVIIKYGDVDTYHYELNLQGDVIAILDSSGNRVVEYAYDAWGNILSITGSKKDTLGQANPLRYRGYVYDHETGLYYCQSRYYDPEIGRFINSDVFAATGQTLVGNNMFAYCGNNPVNRADDSGTFWETVWDIVSLATSVAEVAINPTDPWAWAGLAGDIVDVVLPCVGGVGEVVDTAKTAYRVVDTGEDIIDEARTIYRLAGSTDDIKGATGAYVVLYEGGQHYIGKGGFRRAITSAENHMTDTNKVAAIIWTPTSTQKGAFVTEYLLQSTLNSISKNNEMAYNLIWSPGRKLFAALQ